MVQQLKLKCGRSVFVGRGGASGLNWGFGHQLNNAIVNAGGQQYEKTGAISVHLRAGGAGGKLLGWDNAADASSFSGQQFIAVNTAVVDGVMAAAGPGAKLRKACARASQGRPRDGGALSSTHPDSVIAVGAAAGWWLRHVRRSDPLPGPVPAVLQPGALPQDWALPQDMKTRPIASIVSVILALGRAT